MYRINSVKVKSKNSLRAIRIFFSCMLLCLLAPVETKASVCWGAFEYDDNKKNGHFEILGYRTDMEIVRGDTLTFPTREDLRRYSGSKPIYIGKDAFKDNPDIKYVIFNEDIRGVDESAFDNCKNLKGISIQSDNFSIGKFAFRKCESLEKIEYEDDESLPCLDIGPQAFQFCNKLSGELRFNENTKLNEYSFFGCSGITGEIVIPKIMNEVPQSIFYGCSGITKVTLHDNIKKIGKGAFNRCTGLTEINFPDNLEGIEGEAFYSCQGLTGELKLPKKISYIGGYAFQKTGYTGDLILPEELEDIGQCAFADTPIDGELVIYNKLISIWMNAFENTKISAITHFSPLSIYPFKSYPVLSGNAFRGVNDSIPYRVPEEHIEYFKNDCGDQELAAKFKNIMPIDFKIEQSNLIINENGMDTTVSVHFNKYMNDKTIEYYVDDDSIASVDQNGVVSAKSVGNTVLYARCNHYGITAKCPVRVRPLHVDSIAICHNGEVIEGCEVNAGDSIQLECLVFPEDAVLQDITWSVTNDWVASVDENGLVTGGQEDDLTEIIATTENGKTARCSLHVKGNIEIYNLPDTLEMFVHDVEYIYPYVYPDWVEDKTVEMYSTNTDIVEIQENKVIAKSVGEASIIAKSTYYPDIEARCVVKVKPIVNVSINIESQTLYVDETLKLEARIESENEEDPNLIWTSNNENVATVDESGMVTAHSKGTATIRASSQMYPGYFVECRIWVEEFIPLVGIHITQGEDLVMQLGKTETLHLFPEPYFATFADHEELFVWSSSDESVVTVGANPIYDNRGGINVYINEITAVGVGEAEVKVSGPDGLEAICRITVKDERNITYIYAITRDMAIKENETMQIKYEYSPENANEKIRFISDDESVATVDEDGFVTGVCRGETKITLKSKFADSWLNVYVLPGPVFIESISIVPSEWHGTEGESFQIEAIIEPEGARGNLLEWSSSDENIATVDYNGLVRVMKNGNCVITAKATDGTEISAQCFITSVSEVNDIIIDDDERFDVYTLQGILIKSHASRYDLKKLSTGTYIIRIGNNYQKIVLR